MTVRLGNACSAYPLSQSMALSIIRYRNQKCNNVVYTISCSAIVHAACTILAMTRQLWLSLVCSAVLCVLLCSCSAATSPQPASPQLSVASPAAPTASLAPSGGCAALAADL